MYLEERTKGPRRSETSIAFLKTYEHTIVHEFMHVGRFGYREKSKFLNMVRFSPINRIKSSTSKPN
jgi:hypothetical protein